MGIRYSGGPQGPTGATGAAGAAGATGATGATGPTGIAAARNSVQFDKTNSTTLANVTGLSLTLAVGTYIFRAAFSVTADILGQAKVAINGTVTASALAFDILTIDTDNQTLNAIHLTSKGTEFPLGTAGTAYLAQIEGTIVVSVTGTLTVQFAQNGASNTSSVLAGGFLSATILS